MHLSKKLVTKVAVTGTACVAVALPAIALAANPKKGRTYSDQKVLSFAQVSKNGKSAKLTVYAGKCNGGFNMNTDKPGKISNGKITYDGSATSVTKSAKGHIKLAGKWVSPTKLKWTATVKVGSCKATVPDTLDFPRFGGQSSACVASVVDV
jgi:hypothetical protein